MPQVKRTSVFSDWLTALKDRRAAARIAMRIERLALGNPGDAEPVGAGVSELKIDYGPGYRVYFTVRGKDVTILLCGGDKGSQKRDIKRAKTLAGSLTDDDFDDTDEDDDDGKDENQQAPR